MANRLTIAVFLWAVLPNAAGAWSVDREALKAAIERDRRAERCEAPRLVRSRGGGVKFLGLSGVAGDPLARAGMRTGDVLFAADGQAISEPAQVTALYDAARRGVLPDQLTIRRRGLRIDLAFDEVDLGAWVCARRPAPSRILPVYEGGQHTGYEVVVLGMHFPPRIVAAYRDARLVGWKFVGVGTESTAARLGFRTSDVIVAIDGRAVVDVADVLELKEELLAGVGPHQVEVERRGVRRMVEWWW